MADCNATITLNIIWWFLSEDFGFFSLDEFSKDDLEGIVHQLHAENLGLA